MKNWFILLVLVGASACEAKSIRTQTENTMQQRDIISLVKKNDVNAVRTALQNGTNVNATDGNGRSLLLIATNDKNVEIAKLLVSYKADVNQQAQNADSPFLYAGASGQTELVKLYLENNARFDLFNRYGGTALIPACERGHIETVKVLVKAKDFPINHVNKLGWTALMEAIILGDGGQKYQKIIQILKDNGANLSIPDHDGITPLQHAKSRGFKEIVKILES
jgi:ankyrin repeat protein